MGSKNRSMAAKVAAVKKYGVAARAAGDAADTLRMYCGECRERRVTMRATMRTTPEIATPTRDAVAWGNSTVGDYGVPVAVKRHVPRTTVDPRACAVVYYLDGRVERMTSSQHALGLLRRDDVLNMVEKVYLEKSRRWYYAD